MKDFVCFATLGLCMALSAHAQEKKPIASPAAAATPFVYPPTNVAAPAGAKWQELVKANNDAAHQRAKDIALVFDGDSITYGWQKEGAAIWAERYAPLGAVDFGIPGDRTQHVLWRLKNGQMDGLNPKLILLMIGTNNSNNYPPEKIAEGVAAIVKEYRRLCPDSVIAVQGIFPRGINPTDPRRAKLAATNALIAQLADGNKVIYLDFGDKFLEPDGKLSKEIMRDYLHPSAKGYAIWAEAIQPVIDKYVSKN